MPSIHPHHRERLTKSTLATALTTSKTTTYIDNVTPIPSSSSLSSISSSTLPTSLPTTTSHTIRSLSWSPLGNLIATADNRCLRIWNPERASVRYSTEIRAPASSPSSTSASTSTSSSSSQQGAHLWNVEKLLFNPTKEAELACISSDGNFRLYDIRSRNPCTTSVKLGDTGCSLSWHPEGTYLIAGRKDDTLLPLDYRKLPSFSTTGSNKNGATTTTSTKNSNNTTIPAPEDFVSSLTPQKQSHSTTQTIFSNSGTELLLTTPDSHISILSFPSFTPLKTLPILTSSVYSMHFSPLGRSLAIGGSDALISIYDTTSLTPRFGITEIAGPVRSLSYSFDGTYIVAGSEEVGREGLIVFGAETGEVVSVIDLEGVWNSANARSGSKIGGSSASGGGGAGVSSMGMTAVGDGGVAGSGTTAAAAAAGGASDAQGGAEAAGTGLSNLNAPCVAWHPSRYWLAYGLGTVDLNIPGLVKSDATPGLRILGASGGIL